MHCKGTGGRHFAPAAPGRQLGVCQCRPNNSRVVKSASDLAGRVPQGIIDQQARFGMRFEQELLYLSMNKEEDVSCEASCNPEEFFAELDMQDFAIVSPWPIQLLAAPPSFGTVKVRSPRISRRYHLPPLLLYWNGFCLAIDDPSEAADLSDAAKQMRALNRLSDAEDKLKHPKNCSCPEV